MNRNGNGPYVALPSLYNVSLGAKLIKMAPNIASEASADVI